MVIKNVSNKTKRWIKHLVSVGLDINDYPTWRLKWTTLCQNTKDKTYECKLSFEQYIDLAIEAGIYNPGEIGKGIDSYQMGRLGDLGNYEVGNCRFITHKQNKIEKIENDIGFSIGLRTISEKMTGRTKQSHDHIKSQSIKISKTFIVTSPEGVEFKGQNLKEFCKLKCLDYSSMTYSCRSGVRYKGWVGKYI